MTPNASAQFGAANVDEEHVYMNGAAMSCGQHPSLPKRHRWQPWRTVGTYADGTVWKSRVCGCCALTESNS